ncbi:MAG: DUF177 domain-containing protein [Woeseiaceae bacterium]
MANALTDRALPAQLAESGQVIETKAKLSDFRRLREVVEADLARLAAARVPKRWRHAPIDIRLAFGWADVRRQIPAIEGQISARIDAVCQRCLEPFELSLNAQLKLLLPGIEGDATAFEEYEIWETADDTVRPLDIVDEALIMAMPMSAAHDDTADCGPLAEKLINKDAGTVRPFADLKSQMRNSHR